MDREVIERVASIVRPAQRLQAVSMGNGSAGFAVPDRRA